jgi:hypothetical protein
MFALLVEAAWRRRTNLVTSLVETFAANTSARTWFGICGYGAPRSVWKLLSLPMGLYASITSSISYFHVPPGNCCCPMTGGGARLAADPREAVPQRICSPAQGNAPCLRRHGAEVKGSNLVMIDG